MNWKSPSKKRERLSLSLPLVLIYRIRALAKKEGVKLSHLVQKIVSNYFLEDPTFVNRDFEAAELDVAKHSTRLRQLSRRKELEGEK